MRIRKSNQNKERLPTAQADPLLPGTSQPAAPIGPIRMRAALWDAFKNDTVMLCYKIANKKKKKKKEITRKKSVISIKSLMSEAVR